MVFLKCNPQCIPGKMDSIRHWESWEKLCALEENWIIGVTEPFDSATILRSLRTPDFEPHKNICKANKQTHLKLEKIAKTSGICSQQLVFSFKSLLHQIITAPKYSGHISGQGSHHKCQLTTVLAFQRIPVQHPRRRGNWTKESVTVGSPFRTLLSKHLSQHESEPLAVLLRYFKPQLAGYWH